METMLEIPETHAINTALLNPTMAVHPCVPAQSQLGGLLYQTSPSFKINTYAREFSYALHGPTRNTSQKSAAHQLALYEALAEVDGVLAGHFSISREGAAGPANDIPSSNHVNNVSKEDCTGIGCWAPDHLDYPSQLDITSYSSSHHFISSEFSQLSQQLSDLHGGPSSDDHLVSDTHIFMPENDTRLLHTQDGNYSLISHAQNLETNFRRLQDFQLVTSQAFRDEVDRQYLQILHLSELDTPFKQILKKIIDTCKTFDDFRDTGTLTMTHILFRLLVPQLEDVLAFSAVSYALGMLLLKLGKISHEKILEGLGTWRDIMRPADRSAFEFIALKLWPEARERLSCSFGVSQSGLVDSISQPETVSIPSFHLTQDAYYFSATETKPLFPPHDIITQLQETGMFQLVLKCGECKFATS